jgi:Rrf2 family nitric oxide-sensitive transcriptional repressor
MTAPDCLTWIKDVLFVYLNRGHRGTQHRHACLQRPLGEASPMRLTVFTDYALRILMVLASREGLVTIADVAKAFGISQAHLMKVTHALGKTGWVETVRGRNGGMRLAVDPRALKLDAVVRRLEPDLAAAECFGEQYRCALGGACAVEQAVGRATEAFFRELGRYSLADLVLRSPGLDKLDLWQPLARQTTR